MIRLTEKDSAQKVNDATEKHIHSCNQSSVDATKYKNLIQPLYDDFVGKKAKLEEVQKTVKFAKDAIKLSDKKLDNILRDLSGRAKEYDRNNSGTNVALLLFPNGNVTDVIYTSDEKEIEIAHSIAQKIVSLGPDHELFTFAAKIDQAVTNSRTAFDEYKTAQQNEADAKTALTISKVGVVKQYNANYFIAATDVDKTFAESLFPSLRKNKKKTNNSETEGQSPDNQDS